MEIVSNQKKYRVSFPHLGNYAYPIYNLLDKLIDKNEVEIILAPNMSINTIELGAKASPDFVCVPFKYNMGNFIESLEKGANFLIQAGRRLQVWILWRSTRTDIKRYGL